MKVRVICSTCVFLLIAIRVQTAPPDPAVLGPPVDVQDAVKAKAKEPEKKPPEKKPPEKKGTPAPDVFDPTLLPRADIPTGFNPHMLGDFPGYFAQRRITVIGTQTTTTTTVTRNNNGIEGPVTTTTTTTTPVAFTRTIVVPVPAAGAFKIAENASPRPVDRVFFTWNYFDDLRGPQTGFNGPLQNANTLVTPVPGGVATSTVNTFIPGTPQLVTDLYREVFGFEKTFLDGNASIELRVPFVQLLSNLDGFGVRNIGDLTLITKLALLNNRETSNVFSVGLAVTVPTGPGIDTIDGDLHSTLLQPWFGYIWNRDRFFLQAFHSVVIPTDPRDVTLFFNDVGLNYWLYRGEPDRLVSFVVPMVEAHVTTPLNHRDAMGPIFVPDLVVMTGGAHVGMFRNTTLSLGVATPVSGPRAFRVEAFLQLNWRR